MLNTVKHECDYCMCRNMTSDLIKVKDEYVYLCQEHQDSLENETGYCGTNCILGYGCDQSC